MKYKNKLLTGLIGALVATVGLYILNVIWPYKRDLDASLYYLWMFVVFFAIFFIKAKIKKKV